MDFLKRLFGGGGGRGGDKDGLYIYVRSHQTGEVIQVRIHRFNDLSLNEEGEGYHVRKVIVGEKSFDRIEALLTFDSKRQLTGSEIIGGELADEAAYEVYRASRAQATTP